MDIIPSLEPKLLIRLRHGDLAQHFQSLIRDHHVDSINNQISHLIHTESLPATVYAIWLPIALRDAPHLLATALTDLESHGIRLAAISAISRSFRSPKWRSTWKTLGEAEGIIALLTQLSITDVRAVLTALGRCRNHTPREEIAACMEGLVVLLEQQDDTRRPLAQHTDLLLPLCSAAFVETRLKSISDSPETKVLVRRLAPHQVPLLRRVALEAVDVPRHLRETVVRTARTYLVRSRDPYTPIHATAEITDPGIAFCIDFFRGVSADKRRDDTVKFWVNPYIKEVHRLVTNRRTCFDQILPLLKAAVPQAVQFSPSTSLSINLVRDVLRYWSLAFYGRAGDPHESVTQLTLSKNHPSRPSPSHREELQRLVVEILRDHPDERLKVKRTGTGKAPGPATATGPGTPQQQQPDMFLFVRDLLLEVAPLARLPLLRLLCAHNKFLAYDLTSSVPSTRERNLVPVWQFKVHRILPAEHSKTLFMRSSAIYDHAEFIPAPDITPPNFAGLCWVDQCKLKVRWDCVAAGDMSVTHRVLAEFRTRAQRSRDAATRAVYAGAAIISARETLSLDILHDTLRWTRRFIQDPGVFPDLLKIMLSPEMACLVSCVKVPASRQPSSLDALSIAVQQSHAILDTIRDLILQYFKEPGASDKATMHIPEFIPSLVYHRMIKTTKADLGTSKQLADILLQPLIPVIMTYEHVGLNEAEVKIQWPTVRGILQRLACPDRLSDEVLAFVDQVAQQRDQLIQSERQTLCPDVLSLDPAWPRGLPIQDLLPSVKWALHAMRRPHAAPFVTARIRDIVFAPEAIALSPPPHNEDPIRQWFIDDLLFAIQAYTGWGHVRGVVRRLREIWDHYASMLAPFPDHYRTFQRWFSLRIVGFNRRVQRGMRFVRPHEPPTATYLVDPIMPEEVIEWHPRPALVDELKEIPIIVLYCRAYVRMLPWPAFKRNETKVGPLGSWPFPGFVGTCVRSLALESRDAIGLSALLMLETFTKKRLLPGAFPEQHLRYPPMYLEGHFVNLVNQDPPQLLRSVPQVLKHFMSTIPAGLLRELCSGLLDTLAAMDAADPIHSSLLRCTVHLIKLLSDSHKPDYAVDIVLRFLQDFPNESSYHRHLKLSLLGDRLSPAQAHGFIQQIARIVSTGSKISTAKQLAQLVHQVRFLSPAAARHILHDLVTSTTHIDARVDAVASIFTLLRRNTPQTGTYKLLKHLSLLAACPSEREHATEQDWAAAEADSTVSLPSISPPTDRPLLELFVHKAAAKVPDPDKRSYLTDILLPLLAESTSQHARWMRIFLSRLNLPDTDTDMHSSFPFGAFDPVLVDSILAAWGNYLPASFLALQRALSLSYIHHRYLQRITAALAHQNVEFRQTDAGTHWAECLHIYQETYPFGRLHMALNRGLADRLPDGLTVEALCEEFRLRAATVARHPIAYDPKTRRFRASAKPLLEGMYRMVRSRGRGQGANRVQHYRLVQRTLEMVVQDIETLHAGGLPSMGSVEEKEEEKEQEEEDPVVLPSTMELQVLLLLPEEGDIKGEEEEDDPVGEFARRMLQLVTVCVGDPVCLLEWEALRPALERVQVDHLAKCAVLLGDVGEGEAGLDACLRVRLALVLLTRMEKEAILLDGEVHEMVQRWKRSENDFIRRKGWAVDGEY
ncbi:hypothetical protein FE257_000024 [Aspergillus nanangensis]|uniref:Uncharacterized protein n=1 Tax=Aspergillus nanangensis TaxID=2582783 RepID=A0AAD4GZJ1_ASPNN|nr:hypothetical protein FE257_000024 [Aspergillus nanangensis]